MEDQLFTQRTGAVRRFNRFYTRQIGLLTQAYLDSPFSLTEARVIFELAQIGETSAAGIGSLLDLDAGYLSRILRKFEKQGLIYKKPSETDKRQVILSLSEKGKQAFAALNARSQEDIAAMLAGLDGRDQQRLIESMVSIQTLLGETPQTPISYILRSPQPGDMGWVVQRHGELYASEYGWNEQFEALVAEIVASYLRHYDAQYERCWIAEKDGQPVGSVFVVKNSPVEAKLRMLLVDPKGRGMGLGTRLVEEAIRFARQTKYQKMVLWTNSVLSAARHIYAKTGFTLVSSEPFHDFGKDLISETWELSLTRD